MNFTVKPELKILYPGAHFGSLTTNNLQNMKKNSDLETTKRSLEQKIRETYPDPANDPTISDYNLYYAKWSKIYPIALDKKHQDWEKLLKCIHICRCHVPIRAGKQDTNIRARQRRHPRHPYL